MGPQPAEVTVRAVLDVNVLVSTLLSPAGTPGRLLAGWQAGQFELMVSPRLLAELERALAYPKLRRRVAEADARAIVSLVASRAVLARDPEGPPPVNSADPDDDYLLALAADRKAVLVSGDRDLLSLGGAYPIYTPAEFLGMLGDAGR